MTRTWRCGRRVIRPLRNLDDARRPARRSCLRRSRLETILSAQGRSECRYRGDCRRGLRGLATGRQSSFVMGLFSLLVPGRGGSAVFANFFRILMVMGSKFPGVVV